MVLGIVMAASAGLAAGFTAGMVTFKRSLRWCQVCGSTLDCPACSLRPVRDRL